MVPTKPVRSQCAHCLQMYPESAAFITVSACRLERETRGALCTVIPVTPLGTTVAGSTVLYDVAVSYLVYFLLLMCPYMGLKYH